jgi:hypothetical protein
VIRQSSLKRLASDADATFVPGTNLFPDETDFTIRPAWQVIEAARRQYLTGELTLHTTPTTRIFMRDGTVYFAERSTDGGLPIRLMMEGVITRDQMQRGTVIVNGVEHVGRMFEADPTIDRSSVELCVELFTDDVLVDVANRPVTGYELALYRRHPSGIDRWYPHTAPAAGRHNDSHATQPETATVPVVAPEPQPQPQQMATPTPQTQPQPQAMKAPVPEPPAEPRNKLDAPPITQAVPVTRLVTANPPPPPNATQQIPLTPPVTTQLPVVTTQLPVVPLSPPTAQIPVTPPADAAHDVDASSIADEVAEAIKRAFAGTGAG